MKYINMQSIINYRIPIKEDGTAGNPEIVSKFTRETKDTYAARKVTQAKKEEAKKEVAQAKLVQKAKMQEVERDEEVYEL
ncbi:MAG: hypothetical protein B6V02_03275 [Thermoprotei archaeon ex4572_64]|nr:MAG: hypothetical protein B6V02_03275 [Thermoprotei archaeon ex4572_64]